MTSQAGKQTMAMNFLLSISINNGSQTMKFSQLTEYNRNNFIEISYKMWWRNYSQTLF